RLAREESIRVDQAEVVGRRHRASRDVDCEERAEALPQIASPRLSVVQEETGAVVAADDDGGGTGAGCQGPGQSGHLVQDEGRLGALAASVLLARAREVAGVLQPEQRKPAGRQLPALVESKRRMRADEVREEV